jgi:hypothetical protein
MIKSSSEDVKRIAFEEVLVGAQSYLDDWTDEEGEYTTEDAERIRGAMRSKILALRERNDPELIRTARRALQSSDSDTMFDALMEIVGALQ